MRPHRETLAERLARIDAIPMRRQFALAYRAERAMRSDRPESVALNCYAFNRTSYAATRAAMDALTARQLAERPSLPLLDRLDRKRQRDALWAHFNKYHQEA